MGFAAYLADLMIVKVEMGERINIPAGIAVLTLFILLMVGDIKTSTTTSPLVLVL